MRLRKSRRIDKIFSRERFPFSYTWVHENDIIYEKTTKNEEKNVTIVLISCKKPHKPAVTAVCVAHKG